MTVDKALESVVRNPDDAAPVQNARGKSRQLAGVLASVDQRIADFRSELQQLDAEELRRVEKRIPAAVKGGADVLLVPDAADTEATEQRARIEQELRRLRVHRSAVQQSLEAADAEVERLKAIEVEKIVSAGKEVHRKIVSQMAERLAAVAELNESERRVMEAIRKASGRSGIQLAGFDPCGLPGDSNSLFGGWLREQRKLGYPV